MSSGKYAQRILKVNREVKTLPLSRGYIAREKMKRKQSCDRIICNTFLYKVCLENDEKWVLQIHISRISKLQGRAYMGPDFVLRHAIDRSKYINQTHAQ